MAFSNSTTLDEMRFRTQQHQQQQQQPARNDPMLVGLVSPPRNGNRVPSTLHSQETRSGLTRRFTTDSGRVPTIGSLAVQRGGGQDTQDYGPSTYHKVQLLEKKKMEYERLREQKRRFEAEMQLLDLQQRREEQELAQMAEDLGRTNNGATGHQSEPTTPPEYRETNSGFPSAFSRPNRYSTSSLASPPPGLYNRSARSGSQLASPSSGLIQSPFMDDKLPSKSVPTSGRNSDDEKEQAVRQDPTSHRSTNALNRYSMPVTKSRNGIHEMLSLDQTNTARFLFGEEDGASSSDVKSYLQMNTTDDKFPILVRREEYPGVLSASSAALDLALSQSPGPEAQSNGWNSFARHRPAQQSLPMNALHGPAQFNGSSSRQPNGADTPVSVRPHNRHSLDLKFFDGLGLIDSQNSVPNKQAQAVPPKLQSSYSTNDVPTMRNSNGSTVNGFSNGSGLNMTPNSHAQQHLHNHNASLGRIPPSAMNTNILNNRLSREMTSGDSSPLRDTPNGGGFQSLQSALQASAAPFGPALTQATTQGQTMPAIASPNGQQAYPLPGYYNYNNSMQMLNMSMQSMQVNQNLYNTPTAYNNFGGVYSQNGSRDSQTRVIQQRRQNDGEAMNRFANMSLDQLGGEIYTLCKDQHGCRYLQKKLEERNPEDVHQIWLETNQHVIELMTDPFGNYLCQKLLEYCNDEERTVLIENASHDLVRIALNQHGTRALQKMIEFISTPGQIQTIIGALRYRVVELIQDLNGNHVIQKCLNKLSPMDAQFIFDAVGHHCVDVGTHRHGCCVLQRCIDHASGEQKSWLIRQISNNAYVLVQDPFGNYVVQYILDLNEPSFTEPLVAMFQGRVSQLSKQKFSSNVIEKCLRCAQEPSKDMLIEEMLQPTELDRLLRDSFANYVIQTALDFANPAMRTRLIDAIRPYLPAIRTTPYGRRIQAKIQGSENRNGSSGQATPNEVDQNRHQRVVSNSTNSVTAAFSSSASTFSTGVTSNNNSSVNTTPATGSRPVSQGSFPISDRIAPPAVTQQAPSFQYGRAGAQASNGNWL